MPDHVETAAQILDAIAERLRQLRIALEELASSRTQAQAESVLLHLKVGAQYYPFTANTTPELATLLERFEAQVAAGLAPLAEELLGAAQSLVLVLRLLGEVESPQESHDGADTAPGIIPPGPGPSPGQPRAPRAPRAPVAPGAGARQSG